MDLIIENGIPEVIIGCVDPNPVVSGKGIDKLKKAGIKVSLTNDSSMIFLNRRFFTFQEKHRPYIILKWAETSDGFIDKIRDYNFELPEWLTDDYARLMVHKWRSEEQAILVGTNTVLYDNPHLTTRYFYGKNPIRMIIDRTLRLPSKLNVFDGSTPTVVFTEVKNVQNKNIKDLVYVNIDFEYLTYQIMEYCYNNNISSLIIEGGTMLIESFIKTNMWDEARIFTSDNLFGRGIVAPSISCQYSKLQKLSNSVLRYYFNHEWHELIKKIRL